MLVIQHGECRPIEQEYPKARDSQEIAVRGDDPDLAFQRGRRDQGIDITDESLTVRPTHREAEIRVPFHDRVREKIRTNLANEVLRPLLMDGEARRRFEILDHLTVDEDARCHAMHDQPRTHEPNCRRTIVEERGERTRIEEVPGHLLTDPRSAASARSRGGSGQARLSSRPSRGRATIRSPRALASAFRRR